MKSRRTALWLLAALAFGLFVLPFFVHLTGTRVLGPYPDGGAAAFFRDYLHGLLTLRWYSWVLALGPVVLVLLWRMLAGPARAARGA